MAIAAVINAVVVKITRGCGGKTAASPAPITNKVV